MKKLLVMLTSGIFIVIIVAAFLLFTRLDEMARNLIEKYGSEITGVKVYVSEVKISPRSGEGMIRNLTIGNPSGYKADHALVMQQTDIKVNVRSLTEDVVEVDNITIDSPEITYEISENGSNFKTIQANVDNYKPDSDKSSNNMVSDKKVEIRNLNITNGKITVSAPTLNQSFEVKLSDIYLNDLGKGDPEGNLPEVMQEVMNAITDSVMKDVGRVTLDNFTNFLNNSTDGILKGTGEGIQGVGEGIETTIEGIFGGGNKQ